MQLPPPPLNRNKIKETVLLCATHFYWLFYSSSLTHITTFWMDENMKSSSAKEQQRSNWGSSVTPKISWLFKFLKGICPRNLNLISHLPWRWAQHKRNLSEVLVGYLVLISGVFAVVSNWRLSHFQIDRGTRIIQFFTKWNLKESRTDGGTGACDADPVSNRDNRLLITKSPKAKRMANW